MGAMFTAEEVGLPTIRDDLLYQKVPLGHVETPSDVAAALGALPELAAEPDDLGNLQSIFTLRYEDDGSITCVCPSSVDAKAVAKAAVEAEHLLPPGPSAVAQGIAKAAGAAAAAAVAAAGAKQDVQAAAEAAALQYLQGIL